MKEMVTSPAVSVLMTVFNGERYLATAVESILNQTYEKYEFILINDGSSDNTHKIITTYRDPRIYYENIEHRGRSGALNYGLPRCHGNYIAFMDCDDFSLPDRLQLQYDYLTSNDTIGFVSSNYDIINDYGDLRRFVVLPQHHEHIEWMMPYRNSMLFPGSMIRSRLLRQLLTFDESITCGAEDYEFMLRLLSVTRFFNINKILYRYRITSESLSHLQQAQHTRKCLALATKYLRDLYVREEDFATLQWRLGLSQYYYGNVITARKNFLDAFHNGVPWRNVARYILLSYLGNGVFTIYRRLHRRLRLY